MIIVILVTQPEAVLLGYPLMWDMIQGVRESDLRLYMTLTSNKAPPTTWSVHTIGWLEINESARAAEAFARSYKDFVMEPFKVRLLYHSNSFIISSASRLTQLVTMLYLHLFQCSFP